MTTFLLFYTSPFQAKQKGWPKQGSPVEIGTLEDLDALMSNFGGTKIILNHNISAPWWAEYHDPNDDSEEKEQDYQVDKLPDDWQNLRWIEVYNAYRE